MSIVPFTKKLSSLRNKKEGKPRRNPNLKRQKLISATDKMKELRKKRADQIKKQRNFFPALILTIFLWFLVLTIIIFTDPKQNGMLEIFFASMYLSLLFTFSLIMGNTRRGVLIAFVITIFFILKYFGIGSFINLFLLIGSAAAFEFFFTKNL